MSTFVLANEIVDELNANVGFDIPDGWYFTYEMFSECWLIVYQDPTNPMNKIELFSSVDGFVCTERPDDDVYSLEEYEVDLFVEECLATLKGKIECIVRPTTDILNLEN